MITTFYADQDHRGRPALLALVATQLAGWGHRVLCVDWDLSRDGVSGLLGTPPAPWGLVDLVRDGGTRPPDAFAQTVPSRRWSGTLDVIPPYGQKSSPGPVDWVSLHREWGLGGFLEYCAEQWRRDYDTVLLDAPWGTGPATAICLAHLPDAVVPLVRPHRQGAITQLLDRVAVVRDDLPYDRGRLLALPVLTGASRTPAVDALLEPWANRELPAERLIRLLAREVPVLAALLAAELEGNGDLATPETTDAYLRRAAAGSPRAAERLARARRAARDSLEPVLVAILPAEEWAALESSVLALANVLDAGDAGAITAATRDLPRVDAPVRDARGTNIPDHLRSTVSDLLRRLA